MALGKTTQLANILALGKNSLCMTAKGHARKLLVENFIQLPTSSVLKERVLVISGSPSDGFFFNWRALHVQFAAAKTQE